ncbi:MAG: hypothetical protein KKD77_21975 [Gammaproteobacteria bacterium]|nr:hypothetical protein [Gammaproteobacteria bacterium]MBU2249431.1 hypothetical protein [Gammaproteobacteria bacterium]MBU2685613.1 hypothetical protein [Gammaproteobacteria bacterium]
MNVKQAIEKGYSLTSAYSHNKEEIKTKIIEEKKKGNKAVLVNIPPSKYSRGYHGMYIMYIIKSPANIKYELNKKKRRN